MLKFVVVIVAYLITLVTPVKAQDKLAEDSSYHNLAITDSDIVQVYELNALFEKGLTFENTIKDCGYDR
jgi:hypothetical protein